MMICVSDTVQNNGPVLKGLSISRSENGASESRRQNIFCLPIHPLMTSSLDRCRKILPSAMDIFRPTGSRFSQPRLVNPPDYQIAD